MAGQVYRSHSDQIIDLLARQGDISAQGALRSGNIWSNEVANLGQTAGNVVGQIVQQKQQEQAAQAQQKRDADIAQYIQGGTWQKNPQEAAGFLIQKLGPKDGLAMAEGLSKWNDLQQQKTTKTADAIKALGVAVKGFEAAPDSLKPMLWTQLRTAAVGAGFGSEDQIPEAYDPEAAHGYLQVAKAMASGDIKTREIKTRNADGSETVRIVPDTPDQQFSSAAPLEKEGTLTEGERLARNMFQTDKPSADQVLKATRALRDAGRDPNAGAGTWSLQEGPDGQPVLFNSKTAETKPAPAGIAAKKPAATKARQDAANNSIEDGEQILSELNSPEVKSKLGPLMGRYNSLAAALGDGDPTAQYIVGRLKGFSALQPAVHGFRAVKFAQDIEHLLTTKQTAESLSSALKGILAVSYDVAGKKHDAGVVVDIPGLPEGVTVRKKD